MSQPTGRSRMQWEAFIEINGGKIPKEELIRRMVADGLSEQEAQDILSRNKKKNIKTSLFLLFGGLGLSILGVVATISSYSAASESGGTYWVYFGAAIGGAIVFFMGLFRLIFRRK